MPSRILAAMPTPPISLDAAASLLIDQRRDIDRDLAERLVLIGDDDLSRLSRGRPAAATASPHP